MHNRLVDSKPTAGGAGDAGETLRYVKPLPMEARQHYTAEVFENEAVHDRGECK